MGKRKRVYLSGPIAGRTTEDAYWWREQATKLLEPTFKVVVPTDYRDEPFTDELLKRVVRQDLKDIAKSAIVLVNAAEPSWGTAMEVYAAWMNSHAKIIAFCPPDCPSRKSIWLLRHTDRIFNSLSEACTWLLDQED